MSNQGTRIEYCVCDILHAHKHGTMPTENYDFGSPNKISDNGINSNGNSMRNTWGLVMMHTCLTVR